MIFSTKKSPGAQRSAVLPLLSNDFVFISCPTLMAVQTLLSGNTGLQEGVYGHYAGVEGNQLKTLMELFGVMHVLDAAGNSYLWRNYIAFDDGTENGWVGRAFMQVTFETYNGAIASSTAKWVADSDGFTNSNSDGPILFARDHQLTPVPLPPSIILLGTGLIGLAGYIRNKRVQ